MNNANPSLNETKTVLAAMATETADLQSTFSVPLTDAIAGWLVPQYALAANKKLTGADEAQRWAILRTIVQDLALLRRGDHSAARLELDREELKFRKANTREQMEKEFWAWLDRPEIREKVFPNQKRGLSRETIEKIERELNLL